MSMTRLACLIVTVVSVAVGGRLSADGAAEPLTLRHGAASGDVTSSSAVIFNFSYVRVERQADGKVHLVADVRGADGAPRPGSHLDLTPQ